jgi:hypothetical protein
MNNLKQQTFQQWQQSPAQGAIPQPASNWQKEFIHAALERITDAPDDTPDAPYDVALNHLSPIKGKVEAASSAFDAPEITDDFEF